LIPELDSRFLHTWLADSRSKGTGWLVLAPAIRRYKVRLYRINTHEVTIYSAGGLGKAEGVVLAIPELDVRFLHNRLGDSRSEDRTSLDPAPATRRYKERHCRIDTHEIAIYSGGGVLGRLRGDAGDPRTRWQIPPRPVSRSGIRYLDVIGLNASYTPV